MRTDDENGTFARSTIFILFISYFVIRNGRAERCRAGVGAEFTLAWARFMRSIDETEWEERIARSHASAFSMSSRKGAKSCPDLYVRLSALALVHTTFEHMRAIRLCLSGEWDEMSDAICDKHEANTLNAFGTRNEKKWNESMRKFAALGGRAIDRPIEIKIKRNSIAIDKAIALTHCVVLPPPPPSSGSPARPPDLRSPRAARQEALAD